MSTTVSGTPGLRAWAAAQALASALRARLTEPVTGRRWRRTLAECPWWCAADHRCTARLRYPSGEHRSTPLSWRTPYGALVATRVQTLRGDAHLELLASVRLAGDEDVARWQGQHLPVGVDLTIRAVLAEPHPVDVDARVSSAVVGRGSDRVAVGPNPGTSDRPTPARRQANGMSVAGLAPPGRGGPRTSAGRPQAAGCPC